MSNNYLNLLKDKEINNENTGWLLRLYHSNEGNKIKANNKVKPKPQDPFVALVYAAFSFLRVAEALNAGKKDLFVKTLVFC